MDRHDPARDATELSVLGKQGGHRLGPTQADHSVDDGGSRFGGFQGGHGRHPTRFSLPVRFA